MAKITHLSALKTIIGAFALIPIFVGLHGIIRGPNMFVTAYNYPTSVDSHFRYLSGIAVGMGIVLLRSLPTIDRDGSDLRRVSMLIFIGGLGRFWSLVAVDFDLNTLLATLTELFLFPILCVWQNSVCRKRPES